ncbi:unnamed protein product [Didymodactylos carnosus]|uniref:Beta-lactamase-related domain-containing protein n=1 Tax=Didymodactylos carnosus TaxID=1234261 RepID=A0A815D2H4_9BILA|nr:unnamed protein product [Didymodactylos carnosus]CAF1292300.1 unnamed protein product [Didymodactylos carnosus]CAF3860458.1 unnamed protein product [Didymodactylos carnosus]CAF4100503.1 unnamed protein product [Didymodactylos carnosus]
MIHFYSILLVIFFMVHSKFECKQVLNDNNYNIDGTIENSNWEFVRDIFKSNFHDGLDIGASLAIYHNGKLVVDLWGGWFDKNKTIPYTNDTLQLVYSTSKGIVAVAVALCVQKGLIDYNELVTTYWPEYGQEGKENTTVADLMSHRAGLPDFGHSFTLDDILNWKTMTDALEKQKPVWKPGTAHGYHAVTFGWLAGELVRRVDPEKRTLGQFIRDEITKPTHTEFYIGLPAALEYRVSPLVSKNYTNFESTSNVTNPLGEEDIFNDHRIHQGEIPAANGITNARSLARIYASLLSDLDDGQKWLLTETILKQATKSNTPENEGDQVLSNLPTSFAMGFMTFGSLVLGPGSFGHNGK